MPLPLPKSQDEILRIQSERKVVAVERALASPFHKGRLDHVNLEKLDDPEEWAKIPILGKEELRGLSPQEFYSGFNTAPRDNIWEYWRSGGSTGQPLFYPRSFEDAPYCMLSFARGVQVAGVNKNDSAHISFPLGIHPVGHMFARAAQSEGVGVNWGGSGANTPSRVQIQLIQDMGPTVWMGMSSYGLHMANLADAEGIDLTATPVEKVMCSAEPLSAAKREKLERCWGAKVFDTFGMTECGLMGAESSAHDGLVVWTDMYIFEVLDPDTLQPVPEGEVGTLVVTPLWTNHATPFLRWSSGDLVSMTRENGAKDGFSIFPTLTHAHRTSGFFKVRGVNINHSEFEDLVFGDPAINDFKCELIFDGTLDHLKVSIEVKRGANADQAVERLLGSVKQVFEVTADIHTLDAGTLAKEFESSVKAPRFVDLRS